MNNFSGQDLRKPKKKLGPQDTRRRYFPKGSIYFTNREHAVTGKVLANPEPQFRIPKSKKLLSYMKYRETKDKITKRRHLALPVRFKDNAIFAASRNISSRLFIKEPPDNVKTVVDIDPDFYNVVQGRPRRSKEDIKVYIANLRNYGMLRQQIGYREDIIIRIKNNIEEELTDYRYLKNLLRQHLHSYQMFLSEDYKKACVKLTKTDTLMDEMNAANAELLTAASAFARLNNNIYKLDSILSVLKVYKHFLTFVAPLPWRQQFDETLKNRSESFQAISDKFEHDNDLICDVNIDKILEEAKLELKNPQPAYMYFTKPEEIMKLFRTMEKQSREYLVEYSKHELPMTMLRKKIKEFQTSTQRELEYFQYNIDLYNEKIERENYNDFYFQEKIDRLLRNEFYDILVNEEVLKLKNCINYVYEQVIGACEEGHPNLYEPMRILEVTYEEYNRKLDSLDFQIVNIARNENYRQDLAKMKKAVISQKELRRFSELTNSMKKAFCPPVKYKRPVLEKMADKKAREKKLVTKKKRIKKVRVISADERDALLAFTDWCEGTDPMPYLNDYYKYVQPVFTWEPRISSSSSIS